MNTTLIIIASIAMSLIVFFVVGKRKKNKARTRAAEKKLKEVFPNGIADVDEGTAMLLVNLKNSVDKKEAQIIFIRSSSLCHIASMEGNFSLERLKQHLAPYALDYFSDDALSWFYDYLLSKRETEMDHVLKRSREFSKISNPLGTDQDKIPEGFGEFGLEVTNPIPTCSVADSYIYLDRLKTADNAEITYDRRGSVRAPNTEHPIDAYNVSLNNQKIATVYICPYHRKTSTKAPKGFKLD